MRRIDLKDFTNPPDALISKSAGRKVRRAILTKDGEVYKGYHYRSPEVSSLLRAYSVGKHVLEEDDDPKCYYCESTIEVAAALQVEHYRPKAKVDKIDNEGVDLLGYYWLGLEWSNLVLACPKCNGKSNKGNRFPIQGNCRVVPFNPVAANDLIDRTYLYANRSPYLEELSLLLHPEIDYPEAHLEFNGVGQIHHKPRSDKGRVTIEIFGLQRPLLLKARKNVLRDYLKELQAYTVVHSEGRRPDDGWFETLVRRKCREMIEDSEDISKTYTLWRKFFCSHFVQCVLPHIDSAYRRIILQIFNEERLKYCSKKRPFKD